MRQYRGLLLIFALIFGALAEARQKPSPKVPQAPAAPAFELTIDNIMRGPGLFGTSPSLVRWSPDSRSIWFQWKKYDEPREKSPDTYVVNADNTGLRKLGEEEAKDAPPVIADWSKNKMRAVFADGGDLYLYDFNAGRRRALTRTSEAETNPRFTRDQEHITFTRTGNLYLLSLEDGSLVQMTDIQAAGAAPGATPPGGAGGRGGQGQFQGRGGAAAATGSAEQRGTDSQEYVKKEERDLLDIIKRRAAKREEDEARRKKENPRKPFALQARQTVTNLQLSPDQKFVIATVSEAGEGSKNSIVPNYVTESTFVEDIPGRSLVGDNQARTRIALIDVATGDVKWVDHGQKPVAKEAAQTSAPPLTTPAGQETAQGQGQGPRRTPAPAERDLQLFPPLWSEDGTRAVLVGRAADNKDRWIFALDPAAGKTRVLFSDHDDAWINTFGGGPSGGGSANMGWMKDDRSIYFLSERGGYLHLYVVSYDGGEPKALTSGKWEVAGAQLSEEKTRFFLTTTEPDPSDRHFFVMPASGGERTRITTAPGHHQAFVSPDEKKLALIYSFTTKPPELYIQDFQPGAKPAQATNSPAPDFWNYPWTDAPIVQVPARDGAMVPGRMYRPKNWKPGGPGVIFVHGAGYAQNVHRGWSGNPQVNLFNHFLMEHGYLVMDLDYRASAGYGRDWRASIYRHMGGKDLDDQVDCARWMAREQGVDPKRIGIYGGSYGGFMTLMAMFTQPDVFAAGAALRPVTDWAHYNHGYTSNILNTPQKDADAYRQSSPIYFAQNLKGALLICHGMVDTNVFFQDSMRLVQRLIELRKENWEFAVYPVEDHGFLESTSWSDEYKRIFKLFETNLKKPAEAPTRGVKKAG
jgi:dipeptidyl aminopeptidase/acylaminoacyl peptidase